MSTILFIITNTLIYSAPLVFAALGGVLSERSGVVNIGIEGMMTIGAFAGAAVGFSAGSPWIGFLAAGAAGALIALLHAFASITCKADQTISGIAINLLGPGFALFLCNKIYNSSQTKTGESLPKIFGRQTEGFLQSINLDICVVIALIITILLWFVLYKTKWGFHIRAVGEHPAAADTLGINVYKTRYVCVILSGVLAGFGGAALSIGISNQYTITTVAGQGFIALAAVIFGKWTPFGAYLACLLFGFTQTLTVLLGGGKSVIPAEFVQMMPYVVTILILVLFVGKSVAPKADGDPYEKGAR